MNVLALISLLLEACTFVAAGVGCFGNYWKIDSSFSNTFDTSYSLWNTDVSTNNGKIKTVKAFVMIAFILAAIAAGSVLIIFIKSLNWHGPSKGLAKICMLMNSGISICFMVSSIVWIIYVEADAQDNKTLSSIMDFYKTAGFVAR